MTSRDTVAVHEVRRHQISIPEVSSHSRSSSCRPTEVDINAEVPISATLLASLLRQESSRQQQKYSSKSSPPISSSSSSSSLRMNSMIKNSESSVVQTAAAAALEAVAPASPAATGAAILTSHATATSQSLSHHHHQQEEPYPSPVVSIEAIPAKTAPLLSLGVAGLVPAAAVTGTDHLHQVLSAHLMTPSPGENGSGGSRRSSLFTRVTAHLSRVASSRPSTDGVGGGGGGSGGGGGLDGHSLDSLERGDSGGGGGLGGLNNQKRSRYARGRLAESEEKDPNALDPADALPFFIQSARHTLIWGSAVLLTVVLIRFSHEVYLAASETYLQYYPVSTSSSSATNANMNGGGGGGGGDGASGLHHGPGPGPDPRISRSVLLISSLLLASEFILGIYSSVVMDPNLLMCFTVGGIISGLVSFKFILYEELSFMAPQLLLITILTILAFMVARALWSREIVDALGYDT